MSMFFFLYLSLPRGFSYLAFVLSGSGLARICLVQVLSCLGLVCLGYVLPRFRPV